MADKEISPKPTPSKRGAAKAKDAGSGAPAAGGAHTDATEPESPIAGGPEPLDSVSNTVKLGIIGVLTLAIAVAVIVFAVAGGDDQEAGGTVTDVSEVSTDLDTKPTPAAPGGEAPTELQIDDIVEGDGKEAKPGDQVSVQYVGVTYDDGTEFDASWDRGMPFDFELGGGQVIPGWDEGVSGIKVGGRRQLTIPPEQAYGAQGSPPDIGPNATLVFVIDLLDVN